MRSFLKISFVAASLLSIPSCKTATKDSKLDGVVHYDADHFWDDALFLEFTIQGTKDQSYFCAYSTEINGYDIPNRFGEDSTEFKNMSLYRKALKKWHAIAFHKNVTDRRVIGPMDINDLNRELALSKFEKIDKNQVNFGATTALLGVGVIAVGIVFSPIIIPVVGAGALLVGAGGVVISKAKTETPLTDKKIYQAVFDEGSEQRVSKKRFMALKEAAIKATSTTQKSGYYAGKTCLTGPEMYGKIVDGPLAEKLRSFK